MKTLKWILCLSLILNVALTFWSYRARHTTETIKGDYVVKHHGKFDIMTKQDATNEYMVAFDDARLYWTIESNLISLNVGPNQSFTLLFEPQGGRLQRTLFETQDKDGQKVVLRDLNADGVPEERRVGEKQEIFYEGKFYSTLKRGKGHLLTKDGQQILLSFDGDRWQPTAQP